MKRIKGHLSKKLKKGQRVASSMSITSNKRGSRREMPVVEEKSAIICDEEPLLSGSNEIEEKDSIDVKKMAIEACDSSITLPIKESEESLLSMSDSTFCYDSAISDQKVDMIVTNHDKYIDAFTSVCEFDLTPRISNASIDTNALSFLVTDSKDSMQDKKMVIDISPRCPNSFLFDDDTMSLNSFHTIRTVERLIHNPTMGIIFLLLLQIKTKKFEIIQVHLPPTNEISFTIADILNQIAIKATDSSLAQQHYRGICRPTNGIEMINLSASSIDEDGECRIMPGEVLIPIPQNRSSNDCIRACKCIFWNLPVVDDLFQQLNPFDAFCDDSLDTNLCNSIKAEHGKLSTVDVPSDIEVKSVHASYNEKSNEKALAGANDVAHEDDATVEVVIPKEKLPNVEDIMKYIVQSIQIYEQYLICLLQKQLSIARFYARVVVKGAKTIIIFLTVRKIIVATRSTTSGASHTIPVGSTDSLGLVGFVEFVLFLSFLTWYQKRINNIQKNSCEPRKIELWG